MKKKLSLPTYGLYVNFLPFERIDFVKTYRVTVINSVVNYHASIARYQIHKYDPT